MSTSADQIDDRNPEDHTISVTSLGEAEQIPSEQVPAGHTRDEQLPDDQFRSSEYRSEPVDDRGPLADDGQPIFPPQPDDAGYAQSPPDDTGFDQSQSQAQAQSQSIDTDDRGTHRETEADLTPIDLTPADNTSAPVTDPAHKTTSDDDAWLALQGRFVDDPAQAVQEAADRVEKQLASLRSGLSSADTEGLRTAFRRYRDLGDSLR